MSRVGCMPCIMCNHGEMKSIIKTRPKVIEKIINLEKEVGRSYFPPNYIPDYACSGDSNGKSFPWVTDVVKYLEKNKEQMLSGKIDLTAFLIWFVETWPQSYKIMKENPDYQYRFK